MGNGGHPIEHGPAQNPEQEAFLIKTEHPPVVREVRSRAGVANPDRVVTEALPHLLTGPESDQKNLKGRRWSESVRRLRRTGHRLPNRGNRRAQERDQAR